MTETLATTIDHITEPTVVRIGLPLPLDVMGTLANLIGKAYPSAKMRMGTRDVEVIIDASERVEHPEDLEAAKAFASEFDIDARFEGMSGDEARMALPEWLSKTLVSTFISIFEDNPEAVNSLEFSVNSDGSDVAKWHVIVAKSKGQSPTEMRFVAEKALAELVTAANTAAAALNVAIAHAEGSVDGSAEDMYFELNGARSALASLEAATAVAAAIPKAP